ncbi:MAG: TonB-dependent siderophore receptor [Opitutales bacterium]
MKPVQSSIKHRTKLRLVACFAALLGASAAPLWAADATTAPTKTAATPSDQDVQVLSPFQVTSDKDYGYLKTNAATATRIGTEIQKVPMTISVISQEFMQDTDLQSTNDIYKYMASASGDSQFASDRPSNNPTPQGQNRLRGFPVNIMLRNGVFLYSAQHITDLVDRIEVIKGPAAVFFGQGYPGGTINYITKRADFGKIPTTLRWIIGANKVQHMILDNNQVLSDKAALRVVAGFENSKSYAAFAYTKRFDMDVSLALRPFGNDKLKLMGEVFYVNEKYNDPGKFAWIFPSQYFKDYNNPSSAMMAAAGVTTPTAFRNLINGSLGNWYTYYKTATGNPVAPLYTSVKRGAYYTDAKGNYIHDTGFNFNNRGSYNANDSTVGEFTVEAHPTDWLDFRYVSTADKTKFDDVEGFWYPYANQYQFFNNGANTAGYYRRTFTQQVDIVLKAETTFLTPIKHKLLGGYLNDKYLQQYWAPPGGPQYFAIPGYNAGGTDATNGVIPGNLGSVPAGMIVYDRNGNPKTPTQVYNNWDPGYEVQPPNDKLFPVQRNALDGYPNQDNAWYVNYQGSLLNDRLTVMGGWRHEVYRQAGQALTANFPWFSPPVYAGNNQTQYPPGQYGYSPSYALSNFLTQSGDSWMMGVSYEIRKDVNVYATISKTFHYNGAGPLGAYAAYVPNGVAGLPALFQGTIDAYAAIGKPLVYSFEDGTTTLIKTVADAQAAITKAGADVLAKNETGYNREIGVKTSLDDGKITATVSLYQADRSNQRKEDTYHQSIDVFNFNYNPVINPANGVNISPGNQTRNFRWYSNDAHDRTQGIDGEVIWTPIRNFQSYIAFGYMWTAKTVSDPTVLPTDLRRKAGYFTARLENAPKYTFKTFNKYTFTDGPARGLDVGLGIRYSSATVISRSPDWNPLQGGMMGGNYTVFDAVVGYPYEVYGYKLKTQLGIYNLTDKVYTDGYYTLAPPRYWTLSTTLSF